MIVALFFLAAPAPAVAGLGSLEVVEGYVVRIEEKYVVLYSHGREIEVPKNQFPKDQMKSGRYVTIAFVRKAKKA